MSFQRCLDFPQFDAIALHLDLIVFPTQKLDVAIRQIASQIPGSVESFAALRM